MRSLREFIDDFFDEAIEIIGKMPRQEIEKAMRVIFDVWQKQGTIYTMGNGGSAGTATHMACDFSKVTIVEGMPRLRVISLNDNAPWISALTNDEGFGQIFREQLINHRLSEKDAIIVISVHGGAGQDKAGPWSQNLGQAMRLAKERGAQIIGLAGDTGGLVKEMADVAIVVPKITTENITPQVEAFHVLLSHLLTIGVKQLIKERKEHG